MSTHNPDRLLYFKAAWSCCYNANRWATRILRVFSSVVLKTTRFSHCLLACAFVARNYRITVSIHRRPVDYTISRDQVIKLLFLFLAGPHKTHTERDHVTACCCISMNGVLVEYLKQNMLVRVPSSGAWLTVSFYYDLTLWSEIVGARPPYLKRIV